VSPLLAVENLSKRFGGLQAVADVSLFVEAGEICSSSNGNVRSSSSFCSAAIAATVLRRAARLVTAAMERSCAIVTTPVDTMRVATSASMSDEPRS